MLLHARILILFCKSSKFADPSKRITDLKKDQFSGKNLSARTSSGRPHQKYSVTAVNCLEKLCLLSNHCECRKDASYCCAKIFCACE